MGSAVTTNLPGRKEGVLSKERVCVLLASGGGGTHLAVKRVSGMELLAVHWLTVGMHHQLSCLGMTCRTITTEAEEGERR